MNYPQNLAAQTFKESFFSLVGLVSSTTGGTDSAPDSAVETVIADGAATTLDVMLLGGACVAGVLVGLMLAIVLTGIARMTTRSSAVLSAVIKRTRIPICATAMTWGAWVGLNLALLNADLSQWSNGDLVRVTLHAILILAILATAWIAYGAAWIFEDAARLRRSADAGKARRFETQAQVIRRLAQMLIVILGIVAALFTFEAARAAMATILASAGLISVIAGLAAQQTLGNVFAGLQLAFTDAIRVGDVVVVGALQESGTVEEITLSYVVVRIWDERRMIVPCKQFTNELFQNWTRRGSTQQGTVEIMLDWAAPMTLIRHKVEQILMRTSLWDGRTWGVSVVNSDAHTVTVRIKMSARDSVQLFDLRCLVREQLIAWIASEEPWARPAPRSQALEIRTIEHDKSHEEVARLASELSGMVDTSGDATAVREVVAGVPVSPTVGQPGRDGGSDHDPVHAARMKAARQKFKKERRRALAERQRELANLPSASSSRSDGVGDTGVTVQMPAAQPKISRENTQHD